MVGMEVRNKTRYIFLKRNIITWKPQNLWIQIDDCRVKATS